MVTNRNIPVIVSNTLEITLYGFNDLAHHSLYRSIKEWYSRGIWGVQGRCSTVPASRSTVLLIDSVGGIAKCQEKPGDEVYLINLTKTHINNFSK